MRSRKYSDYYEGDNGRFYLKEEKKRYPEAEDAEPAADSSETGAPVVNSVKTDPESDITGYSPEESYGVSYGVKERETPAAAAEETVIDARIQESGVRTEKKPSQDRFFIPADDSDARALREKIFSVAEIREDRDSLYIDSVFKPGDGDDGSAARGAGTANGTVRSDKSGATNGTKEETGTGQSSESGSRTGPGIGTGTEPGTGRGTGKTAAAGGVAGKENCLSSERVSATCTDTEITETANASGNLGGGTDADGKKKAEKKNSKGKFIHDDKKKRRLSITVLVILAVAAVLAFGAYAFMNHLARSEVDKIEKTEKASAEELSAVTLDGYVNIALLGVDSRTMNKERLNKTNTDAIIIFSMNTKTKEVNLISVYRDTYLKVEDSGYGKINSALASGGVNNVMKRLNESMDLNIDSYVLFNFKMVADLVDAVEGIEVDVKENEIPQLNKYTKDTARNIGRKKYNLVTAPGKQTLEGVQAVSYGRIRKGVGDDFKRTERMRNVIMLVAEKLKKYNIIRLLEIFDVCLPQLQTNLSNDELLEFAGELQDVTFVKSAGFPYHKSDGIIGGVSYVFPTALQDDVITLHKEMFGQEDYRISDNVAAIGSYVYSMAVESEA